MVTISREAYDDLKRFLRDREANSQEYTKITCNGEYKFYGSPPCLLFRMYILPNHQNIIILVFTC